MPQPNPLLDGGSVELLVVTRHRTAAGERGRFLERSRDALAALGDQAGYLSGCIAQSTDDADAFIIETRWRDVGAYRRALGAYEVKLRAIPLLSSAVDESTAHEVVVSRSPEGERFERSGLADDARQVNLGEASAAQVQSATP